MSTIRLFDLWTLFYPYLNHIMTLLTSLLVVQTFYPLQQHVLVIESPQIFLQEPSESKIVSASEYLCLDIKCSKTNTDIKRISLVDCCEDFLLQFFLLQTDKNSSMACLSCASAHLRRLQIEKISSDICGSPMLLLGIVRYCKKLGSKVKLLNSPKGRFENKHKYLYNPSFSISTIKDSSPLFKNVLKELSATHQIISTELIYVPLFKRSSIIN